MKKKQGAFAKKPLSQNLMFNGAILNGLKHNFIANKRLKEVQIAGIQFSNDSWKKVTDAVEKATYLQSLAINN